MSRRDDISKQKANFTLAKRALLEKWRRGEGELLGTPTTIPRRPQLGPAPLSFAQERLWLLDRLQPGNPSLNQSSCITLDGRLDLKAFERSLSETLLRHEVLTARFYTDGQTVLQVHADDRPFTLKVVDLSSVSEAERSDVVQNWGKREANYRFDLERDLLFRNTLLRITESQHHLLLTTHLIVCDGWSMRLLLRDVMDLYNAFSMGKVSPLTQLPIQYFDFAAWERQRLQDEVLAEHVDYWERELCGLKLLRLQTNRPRPAIESSHSAACSLSLPKNITDELHLFCRSQGVTPFMIFIAALQALLHGHTGQSDFLIFFASTHRNLPETADLVGFFTNILALKAKLSPAISFTRLLAEVKRKLLEAMEHHHLPFQRMVEILRPERDGSDASLFQVMFTFLGEVQQASESIGLNWSFTGLADETERFDLHFFIVAGRDDIKITLRFKTELFDLATAAQVLEDYQTLLSAFITDPALPLPKLTVRSSQEGAELKRHAQSSIPAIRLMPRTDVEKKIIDLWRELLNVDEIGVNESFFTLGGHSLLAPQLIARLHERFQIELPLERLFTAPTVEQLAHLIENAAQLDAERKEQESETKLDLRSEVVLDESVRRCYDVVTRREKTQTVLLTGATGFIGAHLLLQLLQQTEAEIFCAVRAKSDEEGERRLRDTLVYYGLWEADYSHRIRAVASDLAAPNLGIEDLQYQRLADKVDAIYHSGCWVNFTYPYSALKPTNVSGTQNMLRFVAQTIDAPFHLISSTGVFDSAAYDGQQKILECDDLESSYRVSGGYNQSKWVMDKLALNARDRGMGICIYRPGWVGGHTEIGICNVKDFVWNLMKGCVQLGAAPQIELQIEFAAVNHVCASIVHLAQQEHSLGKAFHLLNTHTLVWDDLMKKIGRMGYHLEFLSYEEWRTMLLADNCDLRGNALFPFLSLFRRDRADGRRWDHQTKLKFDHGQARAGLSGMRFNSPPVETLLDKYLQRFIQTGFLDPPRA